MVRRTEVWFYHLESTPLERVLPDLLEKTLAKGWRAIVRTANAERLDYLNAHLWTYRPDSFLPHGATKDGHGEAQPVYLTTDEDRINDAQALFLVDGAEPGDFTPFARCVVIFDGRDAEATEAARAFWKKAKANGHEVTYWQQSPAGKWEQKG